MQTAKQITRRRLLARVLLGIPLLALGAGPPAVEVGKLLEQMPAEGREQKQELVAAFKALSVKQIVELTAMLKETGVEDDTTVRLALHGLAVHVGVPGREAQRRRLVEALSRQIATDLPASVRAFHM